MSVDSASVGRDKLPGSDISPVSVAKIEPISEVGSPGSIDERDDGTSGMRSDAFNMPVNTVTVNGGGTKVTVKAHSDRARSASLSLYENATYQTVRSAQILGHLHHALPKQKHRPRNISKGRNGAS